jgi:hypothetical protein
MPRTYEEDITHEDTRIPVNCPYCGARLRDIRFQWVGTSPENEHTSRKWRSVTCEDRHCQRRFAFRATMRVGYSIEIRRRWIPE